MFHIIIFKTLLNKVDFSKIIKFQSQEGILTIEYYICHGKFHVYLFKFLILFAAV